MQGGGGNARERFLADLDGLYRAAGSPTAEAIARWVKINHRRDISPRTIGGWVTPAAGRRTLPRAEQDFAVVLELLLDRAGRPVKTAAVDQWIGRLRAAKADSSARTGGTPPESAPARGDAEPPTGHVSHPRPGLRVSIIAAVVVLAVASVVVGGSSLGWFERRDSTEPSAAWSSEHQGDIEVLDVTEVSDLASNWVVPAGVDPGAYLSRPVPYEPRLQWMRENGAIPTVSMNWEVALVSRLREAVEIVNIVPVLVEPCKPALTTGYGYMEEHAEGVSRKIVLSAEISGPRPVFAQYGDDDNGEPIEIEDFFATGRITLVPGVKEVISLKTRVDTGYCRWTYRVEYINDTGRQTMTLTAPGGGPFEMTAGDWTTPGYDWGVPGIYRRCEGVEHTARRPQVRGNDLLALQTRDACWGP